MKCFIDKDGYLAVSADNETELYALRKWWEEGNGEGGSFSLKINTEVVPSEDKGESDEE